MMVRAIYTNLKHFEQHCYCCLFVSLSQIIAWQDCSFKTYEYTEVLNLSLYKHSRHRCSHIIVPFVLQRPSDSWVAPPAGGVSGYPADVWGHGLAQRPHHCQRSHRSAGDATRLPHHTGSITGQRHRPLSADALALYELPSDFRSKQLHLPLFLLCFKSVRSVNGYQDGRCEGKKVKVTKAKTSER